MIDQHKEAFREEALELLGELEASLLELEERPDDTELVGRVFRAMHTIKGSGAMFGFTAISSFTHEVETVFDRVRNGAVHVSRNLIDLTLMARDQILALLESGRAATGGDENQGVRNELVAAFRSLVDSPEEAGGAGGADGAEISRKESDGRQATYRIMFKPGLDIFLTGANPRNLLEDLLELGSGRVVAHLEEIPDLEEMDPEKCYVSWDILLTTEKTRDAIRDIFVFVEDDCELSIEVIDEGARPEDDPTYKKLGEILVERGDISMDDMKAILASQKRFGEILLEKGLVTPSRIQSALAEQQHVREVIQKRQTTETASSVRVPSDKLDKLVNLVGELVTVQANLSRISALHPDQRLEVVAEEVERLTAELRDTALNIRMLPIGSTFSKFRRLVRDLSTELGKEVELVTEGEETELDKTVLERLNDPLVHLIRNSIDHGIETPDVRREKGKPVHGTILLKAAHSGDSVVVTIRDDGAGLNSEAIRNKAVERGLLQHDAFVSDKELFALIFAPGFSTASRVTGVSGRGVGMDVVKRAIDSLRGAIDIASQSGGGTTITIKLPLTLAIIESLLVKIGGESFVLPLSMVEECIELGGNEPGKGDGRNLIHVRGALVPYIPLRRHFDMGGEPPEPEHVVITNLEGNRVGFVVDSVVGEHQTVIKTLGRFYRSVKGISGATVLGDGGVALILDIPELARGAAFAS